VFCPPLPQVSQFHFDQFFYSLGRNFIAGGAFNAKHSLWGSRVEIRRGYLFYNSIQKNGFSTISPPGPTYWPTHSNRQPDLLDFFITSIPNHVNHTIQNLCDLSSDHSSALLNILELPTLTLSRPSLSKGLINWKQFSSKLENSTNLKISLKTCNEIESAAQQLVKSIQSAVYECSYPPNQKCHSNLKSFILPPNINILIAEKRRARSRWQSSRLPSDKSAFNNLSNTLQN